MKAGQRLQTKDYRLQTKALIIFFVLYSLFFVLYGCQRRPLYRESRVMMGTYARVVSDDKRAADIAFAQIQRIEVLLSKYLP